MDVLMVSVSIGGRVNNAEKGSGLLGTGMRAVELVKR